MKRVLGIIPARFASVRFPGKPLADILGKPMIQWVYESSLPLCDDLVVATDDPRIIEAVREFGGSAMLTADHHVSGTDRCLEAYEMLTFQTGVNYDIVVNIQGDEPLINPNQIELLLGCFEKEDTKIATLIHEVKEEGGMSDPDMVKVVVNKKFHALYFSRSRIPYPRDPSSRISCFYHIGLYAYTPEVLKKICSLPPSPLEITEKLEQLRWLENGLTIQTAVTEHQSIGVDTPSDLAKVKTLLQNR